MLFENIDWPTAMVICFIVSCLTIIICVLIGRRNDVFDRIKRFTSLLDDTNNRITNAELRLRDLEKANRERC